MNLAALLCSFLLETRIMDNFAQKLPLSTIIDQRIFIFPTADQERLSSLAGQPWGSKFKDHGSDVSSDPCCSESDGGVRMNRNSGLWQSTSIL